MSLTPTSQQTVKDSQGRPISVGDRVISYNVRYYYQRGTVDALGKYEVTVNLDSGGFVAINRIDLEVRP